MQSHIESIICPECLEKQEAIVRHTKLWNVYLHDCQKCGYVIMESEWNKVVENKK